jgi:hypothetical protein
VNKVVAGAGAAATAAVAGSYFGAAGTIAGAAIGSVVTTITTAAYQHSLDRTRETVHAHVRLPGSHDVDVKRVVEPTSGADPGASAQSPTLPKRRWQRRWSLLVGATALIFLLAVLGVTGVELIKGSQLLRGQPGTSVGTLVSPGDSSSEDTSEDQDASTSTTSPDEPATTTERPTTAPADDGNGPGGPPDGTQDGPPTNRTVVPDTSPRQR